VIQIENIELVGMSYMSSVLDSSVQRPVILLVAMLLKHALPEDTWVLL